MLSNSSNSGALNLQAKLGLVAGRERSMEESVRKKTTQHRERSDGERHSEGDVRVERGEAEETLAST